MNISRIACDVKKNNELVIYLKEKVSKNIIVFNNNKADSLINRAEV